MSQLNIGEKNIGLDKTTAWGTETMPSTNDGVHVTSFTPPKGDRNFYNNEAESGAENITTCIEGLDYTPQAVSFTAKARYDSYIMTRIFPSLYGMYAFTGDSPEAGVNKHAFKWDSLINYANIPSLLHTIAFDEGTEIKYIPSVLFSGFTLSNENGFQFAIDGTGDRLLTYYAAGPLGITFPSSCEGDLMAMDHLTILMNDESGGALSGSDEIVCTSVTVNPVRSYTNGPQESGMTYASQPYEGDTPAEFRITLQLKTKDATNAAYFVDYQAGTTKKMTITAAGATISGKSTAYTLYLEFPRLQLIEPITYDFASPTPVTLTLKAIKALANPTGMSNTIANGYIYNTLATMGAYPAIA